MSNTTSLGAIENKTDKRKSFLGKALTIKTGGSKAVNIHLNSSDVVEVFLQPKDTLREALKMVETQRGVKLDPGVYQFKGDSGIVVNMATPAKSLTGNDLFLAPPVNVSEMAKVFGKSILDVMKKNGNKIPIFLQKSFDFLEKERALRTIGLFRLNGNRDEVRKYKILLDEGGAEDFEYPANIDPHTVTSMVKKFLRMLKDPVVPYEMYNDFLKAADEENEETRCTNLAKMVKKMPPEHAKVLRFMMEYLVRLCMYSSKNLITPSSISVVFGPLIFREKQQTSETPATPVGKEGMQHTKLAPELRNKFIILIGASFVENFGDVFGIEEEDENTKKKKGAIADKPEEKPTPMEEKRKTLGNDSLKSFVNLMKKQTQMKLEDPDSDGDTPTGSQTTRINRGRTGTIRAANNSSVPMPLLDTLKAIQETKDAQAQAPPPPAPAPVPPAAAEDNDTVKMWMKFAEEWKRKYNEEFNARMTDKENFLKSQREWQDLLDSSGKEVKMMRMEMEQLKQNHKFSEEKNNNANYQTLREIEQLKREKQEAQDQHDKHMLQMKKEHLLALKNYGIDPNTVDPSKAKMAPSPRQQLDAPATLAPATMAPTTSYLPPASLTPPKGPSPNVSPRHDGPVPSLTLNNMNPGDSDKKISVSARFKPKEMQPEPTARLDEPAPEPIDPSKQCHVCKKQITGQWFEANSKKYHHECFACSQCKEPIKGPFADRGEGTLWCKDCITKEKEKKTPPKPAAAASPPAKKNVCSICNEDCPASDRVLAMGKAYHKDCFRCTDCGSEFENMKFFALDNNPVCINCKKKGKK